ncbi:hypothetical protein BDV96DRAFT_628917 [Lophiotrema nucula]|uniref:Uncharacterized protein n=1 Tax=Lophiotrema nucula TaxID=690887 RepID=A0A6A5ZIL5_9PLEO|nr:hypothetical protein BDV96DRAFT_628917 [Lophiotrema nucula]
MRELERKPQPHQLTKLPKFLEVEEGQNGTFSAVASMRAVDQRRLRCEIAKTFGAVRAKRRRAQCADDEEGASPELAERRYQRMVDAIKFEQPSSLRDDLKILRLVDTEVLELASAKPTSISPNQINVHGRQLLGNGRLDITSRFPYSPSAGQGDSRTTHLADLETSELASASPSSVAPNQNAPNYAREGYVSTLETTGICSSTTSSPASTAATGVSDANENRECHRGLTIRTKQNHPQEVNDDAPQASWFSRTISFLSWGRASVKRSAEDAGLEEEEERVKRLRIPEEGGRKRPPPSNDGPASGIEERTNNVNGAKRARQFF